MPSPRLLLALLCTAQFVNVLDVNAVLVALPVVARDLDLSGGALQWVVTAYVLAFAGCLLLAGRLADARGRRRIFVIGMGLFGAASLACGLAPTAEVLIGARAAQGLGAALTAPSALAMVVDVFASGRPRNQAVAAWTGVAAVGGAAGLVVGGAIAGELGWRWIFLINVPVSLVALGLAPRVLPAGRASDAPGGLDLPGALTATGGLGLLVLAFTLAEKSGPLDPAAPAALAGAAVLLTGFALHERRAAHPLVSPAMLRSRPLAVALVASALLTATTSGGGVIATLHLQDVLELAPARAGLLLLPLSLAVVAGSALAPRLRASSPVIISGGVGLIAVGSAVAAALLSAAGLVVWGVLAGLGLGAASVSATALGASAVAERDRATAGGLLNTAAQVGTALGVAALVLVAGTAETVPGHRAGFTVAAILALGAAVMPAVLLRATGRASSAAGRGSPSPSGRSGR